jgi:hypothetical protein
MLWGWPVPSHPAVRALLELLRAYARVRSGVVAILEASGQGRFKVHLKSLYRMSKRVETGYSMVDEIIGEIEGSPDALRELEEMGIRIVREGGETYVEVPSELLIGEARGRRGGRRRSA